MLLGSTLGLSSSALAQRFPFERSFDIAGGSKLDVSTIRGKIDVVVGEPGRVIVEGTVTVRIGWDAPANAVEIARNLADQAPVERDGMTIRLRPPDDAADRRAVTISYHVRVPRDTEVLAISDSGATTVRGVAGAVSVRTQSGAIDVGELGGTTRIATGSGAVSVQGVGSVLEVTTNSSSLTGRSLNGDVKVRTTSGAVDLNLSGGGAADIETGSSSIRVRGIRGALTATTQSGRVTVDGAPVAPWKVSTGSGSVEMSLGMSSVTIDASSGSGSVRLAGAPVEGTVSKRRIKGAVGGGGPHVAIVSRSGSIRLTVTPPTKQ